jgi:hypothetical protein
MVYKQPFRAVRPCVLGTEAWPHAGAPVLAAAWWVFDKRTAQQISNLVVASDLRSARKDFSGIDPKLTATVGAATGRDAFNDLAQGLSLYSGKTVSGSSRGSISICGSISGLETCISEHHDLVDPQPDGDLVCGFVLDHISNAEPA